VESNAWVVTMLALIVRLLLAGLQSRRSLVLENLALRHQVEVLKRSAKRPHITNRTARCG
jgi:hypothetical protein